MCSQDELACAGSTGLMDAVDTWNASGGSTLESWVKNKASHAMLDWYRLNHGGRRDGPKRRLHQAQSLEAEDASGFAPISYLQSKEAPISKDMEMREQHDILHEATDCLTEKQREAIQRVDLEEEEQRSVASDLGLNETALTIRRSLARPKLRKRFLELGGDRL